MSSRQVGVYLVSSRKVGAPCVIKKGRSTLLIVSSRKVGVPCVIKTGRSVPCVIKKGRSTLCHQER